ncbi:MAG: exodeoxyribonuclease VII small subunit [Candidatus Gracilibacteria bacterium]|jgi:exonuclease VII small subunit|nr:exodeoxyribonuclease VII small subunit [Candidatus Gracilibacteria bacterium]
MTEKLNFSEAYKKLEEISKKLEDATDLKLEDMEKLKLEAEKLYKICNEYILKLEK